MEQELLQPLCHCCAAKLQLPKYKELHGRDFFQCSLCKLISVDSKYLPDATKEIARYKKHHNLYSDTRYVAWLTKVIVPMLPYITSEMIGLDYGCGPNPVLSRLLGDRNLNCDDYDLYFFPYLSATKYDYVFCIEVVEHFHEVGKEWERMLSHLKPSGYLAIMTQTWSDDLNFRDWYYARDCTHTSFYHMEALVFLADKFNLKMIYNDGKSIFIFCKLM